MQNNVILAINYPIIGKDSITFVREIKTSDTGRFSFVDTADVHRAQKFGAEVGAVVDLLNNSASVDVVAETTWRFSASSVVIDGQRMDRTLCGNFDAAVLDTVRQALIDIINDRDVTGNERVSHIRNSIEAMSTRFGETVSAEVVWHGGSNYSIRVTHLTVHSAVRIDVVNNDPVITKP